MCAIRDLHGRSCPLEPWPDLMGMIVIVVLRMGSRRIERMREPRPFGWQAYFLYRGSFASLCLSGENWALTEAYAQAGTATFRALG